MAKSIFQGFIKDGLTEREQKRFEQDIEKVRKGISDFDKRFQNSIKTVKDVVGNIENKKSQTEINRLLKQAESLKGSGARLRKEGKEISRKEAKALLEVGKDLDKVIKENKDLLSALEKQKVSVEKLDLAEPLRNASKAIGQDASKFFVSNIEQISQSGLTSEASTVGLRAISPEVAAITEGLGLDLTKSITGFFGGEAEDTPEVEATKDVKASVEESTEVNKDQAKTKDKKIFIQSEEQHKEHMGKWDTLLSMSQAFSPQESFDSLTESFVAGTSRVVEGQVLSSQLLLENDKRNTQLLLTRDKESTQLLLTSDQKSTATIVNAEEVIAETAMVVSKDHHAENLEKLDDIEDANTRSRGILGKFFGRDSLLGRTLGGLGKVLLPLAGIGTLLKKLIPTMGRGKGASAKSGGILATLGKGAKTLGKATGVGALLAIAGIGLKDVFGDKGNQESLAGIGESISIWGKEAFKSVSNWMSSSIDSGIKFYNENIEGTGDTITEGITEGFNIARRFTTDAIDEGVNLFKLVSGEKVNKDTLGPIAKFYNSAIDETTSLIEAGVFLFSDPKKTLKDTFKPLTNFFKDLGGSISDFFSDAVLKLETTVGDFLSSFALGETFRQKIGVRTSGEVRAEQVKDVKLKADAKRLGVTPRSLMKFRAGEISAAEIQAEAQATILPQRADLSPRTQDSAKQVQEEIAQATTAAAIIRSSEEQIITSQSQQKETLKLMKDQEKSRQDFGSFKGLNTLDNTPVVTSDIGLTMILGGGI